MLPLPALLCRSLLVLKKLLKPKLLLKKPLLTWNRLLKKLVPKWKLLLKKLALKWKPLVKKQLLLLTALSKLLKKPSKKLLNNFSRFLPTKKGAWPAMAAPFFYV